MTPHLLRGAAIYNAAIGTMALLDPRAAAAGLRPEPTTFDVFTTRTVGAVLIALGIASWPTGQAPSRGALLANLVLNALLGGIDSVAIADGTIGRDAWRGVAIHGGLSAALGWALLCGRSR